MLLHFLENIIFTEDEVVVEDSVDINMKGIFLEHIYKTVVKFLIILINIGPGATVHEHGNFAVAVDDTRQESNFFNQIFGGAGKGNPNYFNLHYLFGTIIYDLFFSVQVDASPEKDTVKIKKVITVEGNE